MKSENVNTNNGNPKPNDRNPIRPPLYHDLHKGLILIYASSNHQMNVNWTIDTTKMQRFTRNTEQKRELVNVLQTLALHIKNDYPDHPYLAAKAERRVK